MSEQVNRPHRATKEKKQRHSGSSNPKGNTFSTPGRFLKQAARAHDVREKRLHVPLVDKLPEEPPPLVVAVVGPPQVGKTTLIKSLIRRYTKQTLTHPIGPLTVVTSKRRRLTFIECPSDSLASMIDIAKVVDIVLLMIDGKYGFEMETMEFLSILSATGMPGNVFGILTKLDLFKKQDTLKTQKKRLKHRLWSELYHGAKLFYLSGVVNGRYPDREILNLSRFLSVMKNPRPLVWRNAHPYCLVDRYLDITVPTDIEKNPKCDRTVALYGYLRGSNFPARGAQVHIPGVGDLSVSEIESLADPCPTPHMEQAIAKSTGKSNRRRLGEREKILFAPMSDVGGVLVDKDAVYIDVKTSTFDPDRTGKEAVGLGEQLVIGLQGDRRLLGDGDGGVRLFGNTATVNAQDDDMGSPTDHHPTRRPVSFDEDVVNGNSQEEDSDEDESMPDMPDGDSSDGDGSGEETNDPFSRTNGHRSRMEALSSDSELGSGEEEDDSGALKWKSNLAERAQSMHQNRQLGRAADLSKLMYDLTLQPSEVRQKWLGDDGDATTKINGEHRDEDDAFFKKVDQDKEEDWEDRRIPEYDYKALEKKWTDAANIEALKARFISTRPGRKADADEDGEDEAEESAGLNDSDDEGDGEFEDLETGEGHAPSKSGELSVEAEREKNAKKKEELRLRFEEEDRDGFANDKKNADGAGLDVDEEFGEDEWYEAQKAKIQKQREINRTVLDKLEPGSRVLVEGFRAGTYVRIVFKKVPFELSAHFNPRFPLVIGGLNKTEERFGLVKVRIKRHRWHKKILKTNDPLIFSLGWRRFQTMPVYSISDSRTRDRMLKYSPEHMHCFGTFYGPMIAPNTGFCCVQSFSNKSTGFRVAATGVVLSVDHSSEIVKKLKLKGVPHKIYKNTAIIKDMFASELEIAKFKAGNVKTVSGIRGMIKGRAGHQYPDGYVRAGFEDKILMSDIVFLSTWRLVKPQEFYMPVTNLLMASKSTRARPAAIAARNGQQLQQQQQDERDQGVDAADDDVDQAAGVEGEEGEEGEEENQWTGMRLTGQVRRDEKLATPVQRDSLYRPIERPTRHFNALRVPRRLAAELPFKSQIAQMKPQRRETYLQKRAVVVGGEEKRARDLMQKLTTLRNEQAAKRAAAQEKRREPFRRRLAESLEKKAAREKRERDEYWQREGRKRKNEEDAAAGAGRGRAQKRGKKK